MRVVIAEDLALLRDGLSRLLRDNDIEVVAATDNATDLVRAVDAHSPDVAIIDVRLPPDFRDEGVRAAVELRDRHPDLGLLIVSQYVEVAYATELLRDAARGGIGYLLKDRILDVDQFVDAVRRVADSGTAIDADVVSQLLGRRRASDPVDELTPRERDVLALMAEGRTNANIAAELVVTVGAVEKHAANIFRKLRLPQADTGGHRRVLAVLAWLQGTSDPA
jgi:DNA-binding NarL/FixJ family response regulator